ncbi:MAG TPA: hypothetical protein VIQ03_04845 [Gammaproteobacteria bacterium]
MALLMPNAMRLYKVLAASGILLIVLVIVVTWWRIQQFEQNVSTVFEQIITTNLEMDGLQTELLHIERVLQVAEQNTQAENVTVDDVIYDSYGIERLRNEKDSMLLHMSDKKIVMLELLDVKNHIMNEVRLLFVIALIFLLLATLMAVFGWFGWYFRIELFEDRRKAKRQDDSSNKIGND